VAGAGREHDRRRDEPLAAGGYPAGKLTLSTAVAGAIIARHGSEEQKSRWLPALGDGSLRFCFALTEAGAGSNSAWLQTKATRTPGGWLISGEKTHIAAADESDVMLVVTKDAESGGFTLFGLPLPCDRLRLTPVKVIVSVPERQWTVFYDDVELGEDAVIGQPGQGPGPCSTASIRSGLSWPPRRWGSGGGARAVGLGRWGSGAGA
jgi:hypothetical protein